MEIIKRNFKTLIYISFLVPIILVALVSISHVTNWYNITNPITWATYLSVAVEIAALSALAAISAQMGNKVYFPFIVVTIIQFIGNIYFAYTYIDTESKSFKDWVDLISPIGEMFSIEHNDTIGHKRILAMFSGGMLPLISLSFLHMLVKFKEEKVENKEPEAKEPTLGDNSEFENRMQLLDNQVKELITLINNMTVNSNPEIIEPQTEILDETIEDVTVTAPEQIAEPLVEIEPVQENIVNEDDPDIPKIKRLSYKKRNA